MPYLEEHAINKEFAQKEFGIIHDIDKDRIDIPLFDDDGKKIAVKRRLLSGDQKFDNPAGMTGMLYPRHKIKDQGVLVLCEGEIDCVNLWQRDIPAVTSTVGVNAFSESLAKSIEAHIIILCLDNDEAGREAVGKHVRLLESLGKEVRVVKLPVGVKDVSEFMYVAESDGLNGGEEFVQLMNDAKEYIEPQFEIVSGSDILQMDIPQQQWLIRRVLPVEGFTFIAGHQSSAKSWHSLTIAKAVTNGNAWLGEYETTQKTKVLFLDKENTMARTQKRLRGLGYTGEDMYWIRYPEHFNLMNRQNNDWSDFAKYISKFVKKKEIGLLIIDSFTDIMIGNENDRQDTQGFFDAFRQLFPGISILVLHHASKSQAGEKKKASERFRGSTNITAQIFSGFLTTAVNKSNTDFYLQQTKLGDGEKIPKFLVQLQIEEDPMDKNETLVTDIKHMGEVDFDANREEDCKENILAFLEGGKKFNQQLMDECKAAGDSERTYRRAKEVLLETKIIGGHKEGRQMVYYLAGEDHDPQKSLV